MASARALILSFLVSGVLASVPGSPAVQAQFDPSKPKREIVSVPLQEVSAVELLELLARLKLLNERVAVSHAPENNALILAGDPEAVADLKKVIVEVSETIRALATRQQPKAHLREVRAFSLKHLKAEDAYREVMRLYEPLKRQVATDPQRNRLLAHGDEETLNRVAALLEIIDVPLQQADVQQNLQVRIVWLVSKDLADDGGQAPPEDLADVVASLKRKASIGELAMAAQAIVNVSAGGSRFEASGTAELRHGRALFDARGRLADRKEEAAQVEVNLTAQLQDHDVPGRPGLRLLARLETEITARPGQAIVLGMTPIDSMESIFVIQILE